MAYIDIPKVSVKGISVCVPKNIEKVVDYRLFTQEEAIKFSQTTGVIERHIIKDDAKTTSDYCFVAAQYLIERLGWADLSEIGVLVFVSQTRDYILPSTSCILQERLGLSKECLTLDIPYGCSGYVYGMSVISSMISLGKIKKGLLLVGDVITPHHNYEDKSSYPLFGDSGTATAFEYDENAKDMNFHFATDGSGSDAIIIPDGGYRNRVNAESFEKYNYNGGKITKLDCHLDGMSVFSFGISAVPKSVKAFMAKYELSPSDIDYFVMHQANLSMNEIIRKKASFAPEQVPYSLKKYGNTSCSSIPVTIVSELCKKLDSGSHKLLICGFGVGLSWGTVLVEVEDLECLPIIEI